MQNTNAIYSQSFWIRTTKYTRSIKGVTMAIFTPRWTHSVAFCGVPVLITTYNESLTCNEII